MFEGYEEIGSSNKNLVLKSLGKIKIQWGKKFIDLLDSNGNLNVKAQSLIKEVSSKTEINQNGFYLYNDSLLAKIKNDIIEISSTKLGNVYVSFLDKQNTSEEEKYTALQNIGFIYPSQDASNVYPTNGIIYIEDSQSLFIVNNGILSKYVTSIPNPFPKQFVILKDDDDKNLEGALVIQGEGSENSLKFNNLKIYSKENQSVYNSDTQHSFYTRGEEIIKINTELSVNNIQSFKASDKTGFRIYETSNEKFQLNIDKINVRDSINLENNNIIHQKIGDIEEYKSYDDDSNNYGLYSDLNVFIGGEFRHPLRIQVKQGNEILEVPDDIEYRHFPRYSDELNKGMNSSIFNHDEIILPKKWIPQAANYIEDLTTYTDTLETRDNNLYDGKLFLYKVIGTSSSQIQIRFKLSPQYNKSGIRINNEYTNYFSFYDKGNSVKENDYKQNTILLVQYKNGVVNVINGPELAISNKVTILESKVENLETLVDSLQNTISNLQNTISDLQSSISNIPDYSEDITNIESNMQSLDDRISNLENNAS